LQNLESPKLYASCAIEIKLQLMRTNPGPLPHSHKLSRFHRLHFPSKLYHKYLDISIYEKNKALKALN